MTRLPIPGADNGSWGDILNDFLRVEHNDDGTLKTSYLDSSQKGQPGGVAELDGSGRAYTLQLGTGLANSTTFLRGDGSWATPEGAANATDSSPGLIQLSGDLGGTATSPLIADQAIVDSKVSASANIAQSKIQNLTTDLADKESLVTPGSITDYYRGDKTWQILNKTTVGLSNVDNTTDLNKPISTATQSALDLKANSSDLTGKVNKAGDTMTGQLNVSTNGVPLTLGDNTNASININLQGTRSYVGYDANGYAVLQGGATKGLRLNVNNATFGLGTAVEIDTAGQLKMANATSSGTGILFGGDTNIYRSAANTLKTDDNFESAGAVYSQGNLTVGTGSTGVGINLRASGYNGVTTDIYSDSASAYSYFRRARGTFAAPTLTTSGSYFGSFGFRGHDGTNWVVQDSARISSYATQSFSTTHGGAIGFFTAANGTLVSNGASERLTIYHDGNVGIGVTAPTFKLQLAAATTVAGGIGFGTDTNLYRSAADTLRTDDALYVALNTQLNGLLGVGRPALAGYQIYSQPSGNNVGIVVANNDAAYSGTYLEVRPLTSSVAGSLFKLSLNNGADPVLTVSGTGQILLPSSTTAARGILLGGDVTLYRGAADVLKTDDAFDAASYRVSGVAGASGSFTTNDGKTVTVTNGLITNIV